MADVEQLVRGLALSTAPTTRESSLAGRLVPLWVMLGLMSLVVLVMLLVKLYAELTVGKCKSSVDMSGKTVIITGSNTGIGKETARELARRNARVILACRNQVKARDAAEDIFKTTGRHVACMQLDLCSFDSVRDFASKVIASEERLDVLINNAGMMSPPNREETKDGFEVTFQANHLGHFLLTHLLLDLLKRSQPSRIVVVGSVGQTLGRLDCNDLSFGEYWFPLLNYCTTKQCNMLFTVELSRRLQGTEFLLDKTQPVVSSDDVRDFSGVVEDDKVYQVYWAGDARRKGSFYDAKVLYMAGVTVNCCHPGYVRSDIANRSEDIQTWLFNRLLDAYGKNVKQGSETTVYLAVSEDVETISGKYFSDCKKSFAVPWATDRIKAKQLWEESLKMTKVKEAV